MAKVGLGHWDGYIHIALQVVNHKLTISGGVSVSHTRCFFCDGMSQYGVPENLTTG